MTRGVREGGPGPGPGAREAPASASEGSVGEFGKGWGRPGNPRQVGAPRPARRLEAHSVLLSLDCQGSDFRKSWSLAFGNFLKEANKVNLTLLQGVGGDGVEKLCPLPSPHQPIERPCEARPWGDCGRLGRGGWGGSEFSGSRGVG